MHDLAWLNSLSTEEAARELLQCCGSKRWAKEMTAARPYEKLADVIARANEIWQSLDRDDWLEAFRSHPKIGEKKAAELVTAQSRQWSGQEQAGVGSGTDAGQFDDPHALQRPHSGRLARHTGN